MCETGRLMKRILITGAGGFLGTELVRQMAGNSEVQILALTSQKDKLKQACNNTDNVKMLDRNAVFESAFSFAEIDILINCAFPRNNDGIQMADGLKYISDLLETAVAGGVKAVINISSQSVYSQVRTEPATESTQLNPETIYAVGKYATELMTNCICCNIPHTNIRMASLIGAEFDQRLVNKFVKQAFVGNPLSIKGGKQMFGFLDVRDAAAAIIAVAEGSDWKSVYNLGPQQSYSLIEIAECVQNIVSNFGYAKTAVELIKTDDWQNSSLDSSRLREQFGWKERFSLEDTISDIIKAL